jgi:hypothetical protein
MSEEPWYMTEKGLLAGLFISLLFWFLCVTGCMAVFGDPGFILGHIIGLGFTVFGAPARWILK